MLIVEHHARVLIDAQRRYQVLESSRRGSHMRQRRFGVGYAIDIEEARTRQMGRAIQRLRVAPIARHVPARIEQHQVRRAELLREPFRTDQRLH